LAKQKIVFINNWSSRQRKESKGDKMIYEKIMAENSKTNEFQQTPRTINIKKTTWKHSRIKLLKTKSRKKKRQITFTFTETMEVRR
jgi:hypothetical protein